MHKRNLHANGYDLNALIASYPQLEAFVFTNTYQKQTLNFSDPKAVKALNTALLKHHYGITYWEFPEAHLCPPIPGRVDYIHLLKDLLDDSNVRPDSTILDIGTGATCIYPILGNVVYDWKFMASEMDSKALHNAQQIIDKNGLSKMIELRFQNDSRHILKGVVTISDKITATMCNPPFYKSQKDAEANTLKKLKGLGQSEKELIRNFSGTSNELWYQGGEKAFLHNYLFESSQFKSQCLWFTSLVSKKELLKDMKRSLKKLGAKQIKVLELNTANKISRVVAWTFLTDDEQKNWIS